MSKNINGFVEKMLHCVEFQSVDESGEQVHDFYNSMNDMLSEHPLYQGKVFSTSVKYLVHQ